MYYIVLIILHSIYYILLYPQHTCKNIWVTILIIDNNIPDNSITYRYIL